MTGISNPLLEVHNLKKYFSIRSKGFLKQHEILLKAVDDISFDIQVGETLGLVGESGSGKSTTGRSLLRLLEPTGGRVIFNNVDFTAIPYNKVRPFRKEMQIVFQDPYASLNPRMTVGEIVGEPLLIFQEEGWGSRSKREERIKELLEIVGLNPSFMNRYPHEFSGGQRQRIGIARALALNPKLIVADEPVSALDVSIQAQIINLFQELQEQLKLTYLFIAHDLAVVRHISDRVAVMYLGKIVEIAAADAIYENPMHPYTLTLLESIPIPDPAHKKDRRRSFPGGEPPSPISPPSGCHFHTRCLMATDECKITVPHLEEKAPGHKVSCIKVQYKS